MSSKSSATKRTATNMGTRACTNRLEPDDNRLTRTKPADVLSLYKMLYVTQHLLKKHGVIFWMSGGTFLGAVRHQGLIPWDDDADIEVFAADAPRIAAFESEFRELGFSTCPHNCGMKVFPTNGKPIARVEWLYPFLDIFFVDGTPVAEPHVAGEPDKLSYAGEPYREYYRNSCFRRSAVFPLRDYPFADFTLPGAHNYQLYLDTLYGADWNQVAFRSYDHENEHDETPDQQQRVAIKHRDPAFPFLTQAEGFPRLP
eukprot:gnl/Spiro4/1889_TR887_c0_g1_i1.p1 gnl/Spiro4/1889_TR887_c0_g1~~gnl/Spiro4/1889_TR887_c0_g1_i1.p1  ORF type:complete len:257 (+),score=25.48 gnl/Spiro4/1889_TR887_c0_g1_i1:92-862(+)